MVELPRFDFFSCSGFIHYPRNARIIAVAPVRPLLLGLEGTITAASPTSLEKNKNSHVSIYHWSNRTQACTPKPPIALLLLTPSALLAQVSYTLRGGRHRLRLLTL